MTIDMADQTNDQASETPAEQASPPAAPVQDATPAPAAQPAAAPVDPAPAAEAPPAEAPAAAAPAEAAPEAPAAAAAPPAEAAPAAPAEAAAPAAEGAPAPGDAPAQGDKPKRRRSRGGGSKVAKAWGVKAANVEGVQTIDLTPSGEGVPVGGGQRRQSGGQGGGQGGGKPGGKGGQRKPNRPARPPREKGPLPFDELRDAARTIVEIHGKRQALKDAFGALAQKERDQLSEIVAADGDFRVRARAISAGSLSAGKIGKALAAQQIAIADVQDLWTLTLSKEDAAERQSWIRNAKRRDEERAKKQAERRNSADRISKEDMAKARDGHVSAQVRMDPAILAAFGGGTPAPAGDEAAESKDADKKAKKQPKKSSVLDRLGY
jgi:hypothetical protein